MSEQILKLMIGIGIGSIVLYYEVRLRNQRWKHLFEVLNLKEQLEWLKEKEQMMEAEMTHRLNELDEWRTGEKKFSEKSSCTDQEKD